MRCGAETNRAKFVVSGHVSRSASEPSEASLRNIAVVSLPEMVKPDTCSEATTIRSCMAARGSMGWRACQGQRMNMGSPNGSTGQWMSRVAEVPVVLLICRTT